MNKMFRQIILVASAVGVMSGAVWYYVQRETDELQLREFEYDRDIAFVKKQFEHNWYWLTASDDYDVETSFKNRMSSRNPASAGNLVIKTLFFEDTPVGFVAYFKISFYLGRILFVSVDEDYRSRGYAKYMVQHALDDLKDRGVMRVKILTRAENYAAQKVYTSFNFTEEQRDATFVNYVKNIS